MHKEGRDIRIARNEERLGDLRNIKLPMDQPIDLFCVCSEGQCYCSNRITVTLDEAQRLTSDPNYILLCGSCRIGSHQFRI